MKVFFIFLIVLESQQNFSNSNVNLNDTIGELVKTLERMKAKKDALDMDLAKGESLRDDLTLKLNQCIEELNKVNGNHIFFILIESLEQKHSILQVYDKIINESDSAYSKIVKSTEALYQMVKNEEKRITSNTFSFSPNMK